MLRKQITSVDPEVMSGTPVFAGTRVPVESLIAHFKAGDTLEDFLDGFPSVSRTQAQGFLELALAAARGSVRVLLDGHLDRRLKPLFARDVEVVTVRERGWSGKQNGALLRAAQAEFDVLVTIDKALKHQQNLGTHALGVVVLHAASNRRQDTAPLIPRVNEVLCPGEIVHVGEER